MTEGMMIIGVVVVVVVVAVTLVAVLLKSLGGGGKKSRFNSDGDDYFHSSHRHNGKMPDLLLAPYRLYGTAFVALGLVALLVASLLAG